MFRQQFIPQSVIVEFAAISFVDTDRDQRAADIALLAEGTHRPAFQIDFDNFALLGRAASTVFLGQRASLSEPRPVQYLPSRLSILRGALHLSAQPVNPTAL